MNKQILRYIVFVGLFLIPFVPFLVSSYFFFPYIVTKAFAWRAIVEVVFGAWLVLALWDPAYRPKKSPILYAILGFLAVIGLSNLLGEAPVKSFWSNFERMEGYITMLHLGAFFLVISSVFREKEWKRWWNTSLVASALMAGYALFQVLGVIAPSQHDARVDGTFGNAIYLAVYMLFHIFIALFYLSREWHQSSKRWLYGTLMAAQAFILYFTATRGAILGLLGGLLVLALLNLRNREDRAIRKFSIGIISLLVIVVGGFMLARNNAFVRTSPVLSRFATLNLEDIKTQGRYFIWPMAWEGFKERPVLGWGQENFSYVFQKGYKPEMYILEPWFDRAHNIFLDWMVAGGLVGLLFYLSLYFAPLYLLWRKGSTFSSLEKSVIASLLAAYFFHNFFVFDHLMSYVLFFSLLGYVHSRENGQVLWQKTVSEKSIKNLALPSVSILLVLTLYFANIRPIVTNLSLIEALKSLQIPGQMANAAARFERAYRSSRLGRPEASEQIAAHATEILTSDLSIEEKNKYFAFAKNALAAQSADLLTDARYQLIAGSFLSTTGILDESLVYLERARELAPNKQQVYFELGSAYINNGNTAEGLAAFRKAYELAPGYAEARLVYLIGAIYVGDRAIESQMLGTLGEREVAFDDRVVNAYYSSGRLDRVRALLNDRKRLDPKNAAQYDQFLNQLQNSR